MTSKLTREERVQALYDLKVGQVLSQADIENVKMLSRMALAAMDSSESVELPLDYLQGHKDGLEWAAQLAEANHPETGDWLYDDPIDLAKAIRKGPDIPPAQPALLIPERMTAIVSGETEYVDGWNKSRQWALKRGCIPPLVKGVTEACQGWNACRAAMFQAGNSPETPGAERRIADAVELLRQAAPGMLAEQTGPDGPLVGKMKQQSKQNGSDVETK